MPRTARASAGGVVYHVLNRGNGKAEVYHKAHDYQAFEALIPLACGRIPMDVLGYCLMPNHFHLVIRPLTDGDLGRWMQWLMTSHVRRYHRHYQSSGHVWQGRFKAFPVQQDEHLLTLLRYVERNPLRAGLVNRSQAWRWSSLHWVGRSQQPDWLAPWPIPRPAKWVSWVNKPQSAMEIAQLDRSVQRGTPLGNERWVKRTAVRLGLESTLNPRGRPRGRSKK